MKLQDQCCTREQGQRLVELGVKPEALFWWMPSMSGPHGEYIRYSYHGNNLAPAFNVAELGEMLPESDTHLSVWKTVKYTHLSVDEKWEASLHKYDRSYVTCPTEAQARADLLIHLLENKLLTV